jgi:hypothetical protein
LGTMISFGHDLELAYETEMIKSQDGGHFQISWYPSKPSQNSAQPERKIIVFFPGLSLTAKSVSTAYIVDLYLSYSTWYDFTEISTAVR